MTLEIAIKLLQQDLNDPGSVDILDLNKAQALSMEALTRVQFNRHSKGAILIGLLPGETES